MFDKKNPTYLSLHPKQWEEKINDLYSMMESCVLCPHECGVNRLEGEKGLCKTDDKIYISSYNLHFGEEPPISAGKGSGTIFFTNCNLACVFCQNYPISQLGNGKAYNIDELSLIMLELQNKGAHNINFVTPTHITPHIVKAVYNASLMGLRIPIVYNSSGYDSLDVIEILKGVIDIYMPDAKYCLNETSSKYSNAPDYFSINKEILKMMYKQVGDLKISDGVAYKGVIIRHLVLPGLTDESKEIIKFIRKYFSKDTYVSIMSQYHPAHRVAEEFPELSRKVSKKEYREVVGYAKSLGLHNAWIQQL